MVYRRNLACLLIAVGLSSYGNGQNSLFNVRSHSIKSTGTLIVKPKAGQFESAKASNELSIRRVLSDAGAIVVDIPRNETAGSFASALTKSGKFEYVVPNWKVACTRIPTDPKFATQWHHTAINSKRAWDVLTGTRSSEPNLTIAICDTGVNTAHPDLTNCVPGYHSPSKTAQASGGPVSDTNGHGTQTAGAAASTGNNAIGVTGVGWNFKIMPVRVTDDDSPNGWATVADILDGIYWAASHGAKVVNVSYAGVENPAFQTAGADIKTQHGSLLVFSAGNDGLDGVPDRSDIIIVGATTNANLRASFSNTGSGIDCVAPGVNVYSTTKSGAYGYSSGTSIAAPIVSGALAMIWAMNPALTPNQVEAALYRGCKNLGPYGRDNEFGYGLVNLYRSLLTSVKYKIQPIAIPQGYLGNDTRRQNACSQIAGHGRIGSEKDAVIFGGGTAVDIGDLPGYPNETVWDINLKGELVGGAYTGSLSSNTAVTDNAPYYYNGLTVLPLQRPPLWKYSYAISINDNGNIVGDGRDNYYTPHVRGTPYYWANSNSAPVALMSSPGMSWGETNRIINNGNIVGYQYQTSATQATLWPNYQSAPVLLTFPAGYTDSQAEDVSPDGTVVGYAKSPGGYRLPVVWHSNVPTVLPVVPGSLMSLIWDINDDGVMAGMYSKTGFFADQRACIWENGMAVDLNEAIDPSTPGWVLTDVRSVTDTGQIVGSGVFNGVFRMFVGTPNSNGVQSSLTVNCSVLLEDLARDAIPDQPVTFSLIRTLTGQSEGTYEAYPDDQGLYKLPKDLRGLFNIRATSAKFLSKQVNGVILSDSGSSSAEFSMINGDVTGDNYVGTDDYLALNGAFDTSNGDPHYNASADLTGDGYVGTDDYLILNKNFDTYGD